MDRFARHRTACLSLALAALGAGCADDGEPRSACDELLADFTLTEPDGAVELIPGGSVRLTWPPSDAAGATVGIVLVDGVSRFEREPVSAGLGELVISQPVESRDVGMGIYGLEASLGGCGATPTIYDGGPLRHLYAQGLGFLFPRVQFVGTDVDRDLTLFTVALSTMEVELIADPTPLSPGDGDELTFARFTVPGELVQIRRDVRFTGDTVDGAPIPGGEYEVHARISARGGALTYAQSGPFLNWAPEL